MLKVIVLTAYNAENEIELNINSVKNQTGVKIVDHIIGEGMTLSESQNWIYSSFIENSHRCDFIIKLDADMVLSSSTSILNMIKLMQHNYRSTFLVKDYITGSPIIGVHLLNSLASKFERKIHPTRNDYWLEHIPGKIVYKVFVSHAQLAGPKQIEHFLKQRITKAIDEGFKSDYWLVVIDFYLTCFPIFWQKTERSIALKNTLDNLKLKNIERYISSPYIIAKYVYKKTILYHRILFNKER